MISPTLAKYIDDSMWSDLLSWRDVWFGWLSLSTKVVVVGLLGEAPELFWDISSILKGWNFRRKFRFSLAESRAANWVKVLAFIGWILIVVGVAGEWESEIKVGDADASLQDFISANLTESQKETARAIEIASVNELEAAQLRKDAAELTASNLRLEEAIAPRRLTPKQVRELESLTQFSDRTVVIKSYVNDAEGFLLGLQIHDALSKPHIAVVDNTFTMQAGTEVILGVSIVGGSKALVDKLQAILSENGLTKSTTISRHFSGVGSVTTFGAVFMPGATMAEITVGLKPIK